MPNIIHIKVGDVDNIPTREDLTKVVHEFQSNLVSIQGYRNKVRTFSLAKPELSNIRLIIQAGSADRDPGIEELDQLRTSFTKALSSPYDSVIATMFDVSVEVAEYSTMRSVGEVNNEDY